MFTGSVYGAVWLMQQWSVQHAVVGVAVVGVVEVGLASGVLYDAIVVQQRLVR